MRKHLIGVGMVLGIILGILIDIGRTTKGEPLIQYAEGSEISEERRVVLIEARTNWTPERVKQESDKWATHYRVDAEKMWKVVMCESGASSTVQSHHVRNGVREDSWGVAQFHLPAGNRTPEGEVITKEMALDPQIALRTMAYYFSLGKANLWSCTKMIK